jgi:CBS domain-containing protein
VNASPDDALRTMAEHKIRRLPVIDDHKLVGIVSQGDLAQAAEERLVGETVEQISTAP